MYRSIYLLSMYLCIYVSIYLSICTATPHLSINKTEDGGSNLKIYLSFYLSIDLSIYRSIYVYLSIYLPICTATPHLFLKTTEDGGSNLKKHPPGNSGSASDGYLCGCGMNFAPSMWLHSVCEQGAKRDRER